jgi:hypothetical protein
MPMIREMSFERIQRLCSGEEFPGDYSWDRRRSKNFDKYIWFESTKINPRYICLNFWIVFPRAKSLNSLYFKFLDFSFCFDRNRFQEMNCSILPLLTSTLGPSAFRIRTLHPSNILPLSSFSSGIPQHLGAVSRSSCVIFLVAWCWSVAEKPRQSATRARPRREPMNNLFQDVLHVLGAVREEFSLTASSKPTSNSLDYSFITPTLLGSHSVSFLSQSSLSSWQNQ